MKPLDAFRITPTGARASYCKDCAVERTRQWRAETRDDYNARSRERYAANREGERARANAAYARRKEGRIHE